MTFAPLRKKKKEPLYVSHPETEESGQNRMDLTVDVDVSNVFYLPLQNSYRVWPLWNKTRPNISGRYYGYLPCIQWKGSFVSDIWFVSVRLHVNLKEVGPLTNWIVLLPDSDGSAKSQVPFNPLLVPNPMNEQYVMMYLSPPISLFHNLICPRATFKLNSDVVNRALHPSPTGIKLKKDLKKHPPYA